MTKDEALKLALEALEVEQIEVIMFKLVPKPHITKAITAIKQALAAPVQKPKKGSYEAVFGHLGMTPDELGNHMIELQEQAAQPEWVPVTQELLAAQHPWLYKPMWIAMKDGSVLTGIHEWRQGRNPDRLLLDGAGNVWAFEAAYVMPVVQPEHPDKLKENP